MRSQPEAHIAKNVLDPQQVAIWVVPVEGILNQSKNLQEIEPLLTNQELERYRRFKVDNKREEFLASRLLLSHLLSVYTCFDPSEIEAVPDQMGRPFWYHKGDRISLFFSLSHTRGMVSCAVSNACETGCDIELLRYRKYEKELTKKVFSKTEMTLYNTLSPEAQHIFFYRSWTLKEAFVKAVGEGLRIPLTNLSFTDTVKPDSVVRIQGVHLNNIDPNERWSFLTINLATNYHLSCATQIEKPEITIKKAALNGLKIQTISSKTITDQ